jgi:hypothetical protein
VTETGRPATVNVESCAGIEVSLSFGISDSNKKASHAGEAKVTLLTMPG